MATRTGGRHSENHAVVALARDGMGVRDMSEFKVGDRVRDPSGDEGLIVHVGATPNMAVLIKCDRGGPLVWVLPRELTRLGGPEAPSPANHAAEAPAVRPRIECNVASHEEMVQRRIDDGPAGLSDEALHYYNKWDALQADYAQARSRAEEMVAECMRLRAENVELLRENAVMRRRIEKLERRK